MTSMINLIGSASACRTSSEVIVTVFGSPCDLVTAFNFHHLFFRQRKNRSNLYFHVFGGCFAD